MKITITIIFVVGMFLSILSTFSFAEELPLNVTINGSKVRFPDEKPFIDEKGRVQTPARIIGEALYAVVKWEPSTQTAKFLFKANKLELYIGKKDYTINGEVKQMDTEAFVKNGRTFVPARYVAEAFGATVEWDKNTRTVVITMDYTKKEDKTGTETREGFVIPKDRKITIMNDRSADVLMSINLLMSEPDTQIKEMEDILSQKCDEATVKEVAEYVKQKKKAGEYLADKYVYDKKSDRYIHISESRGMEINVYFLDAEHTKNYKKYLGK